MTEGEVQAALYPRSGRVDVMAAGRAEQATAESPRQTLVVSDSQPPPAQSDHMDGDR